MNSPVALNSLTLAPGERADVLVDFSKVRWWWHGKVIMKNSAGSPFPNGAAPLAGTTDRVMAFSVTKPLGFFGLSGQPAPGAWPAAGAQYRRRQGAQADAVRRAG